MKNQITILKRIGLGLQLKLTVFISVLFLFVIVSRTLVISLAINIDGLNPAIVNYVSMGFAILMGGFVSFAIIKMSVIKPLKEVEMHIVKLAEGDFSIVVPSNILKKKDEFGVIANSFIHMQDAVSEVIREVITKADEVDMSAGNLSKTSEEMSLTSQELSNTMQQVAEGATSQAQDLQGILKAFAVVADEARKLAEESKHAIDNNISLIGTVNKESEDIISTTKNVEISISEQVDSIMTTVKTFEAILTSIENISTLIETVNVSKQEMEKASEIVMQKMNQTSNITEENTASTEEVAASSVELSATLHMLEGVVTDLKIKINQLKIAK